MKKLLKGLLVALFSLVALVLAIIYWTVGTESGVGFVLEHALPQVPGQVSLKSHQGDLLGRLELKGIQFDIPQAAKGQLDSLVLHWQPTALTDKKLHLVEISASGADIELAASEPQPASDEPLQLPEIALPISIQLDALALANIKLVPAPDAEPVQLDQAKLVANWDAAGLHVQVLDVAMPQGQLALNGELNPIADYPFHFKPNLTLTQPDLPKLKLATELQGALAGNVQLKADISGDLDLSLDMALSQLLSAPAWQGKLSLKELRPVQFSAEAPASLSGDLQTSGDLKQAKLSGQIKSRDEAKTELNWDVGLDLSADLQKLAVDIHQLDLHQPDSGAKLELHGQADQTLAFDLNAAWQGLRWPLTGELMAESRQGQLALKGNADDYALTLQAAVSGAQVPAGDWTLSAKGNRNQAQIERLQGNTLEGVLGASGQVHWLPEVQWQLALDGDGINPGSIAAEWPGKLGWRIQTQGALAEGGVQAKLALDELSGKLRDYPLKGKGQFEISPKQVQFNGFELASGEARIKADGSLGDAASIDWQANIRNLGELLPDAKGSLNAKGKLAGAIGQPNVQFDLAAKDIALNDLALAQLQANGQVDLSWQKASSLVLHAQGLAQGANQISALDLEAKGTLDQHAVTLKASHEQGDLSLALQGGLKNQDWAGSMQTLQLASRDLGTWALRDAAAIKAGAKAADLKPLCLEREASSLCVQGAWSADKGSAGKASLHQFPLEWLKPWFPENLTGVEGQLNLEAEGAANNQIQAELNAKIDPGKLSLIYDGAPRKLPHDGVELQVNLDKGALAAHFALGVDGNKLSGQVHSPDLLKADDPMAASLDGKLLVDAANFQMIEALAPDVRELDASLKADFQLHGKIGKPGLVGQGGLDIKHLLIPVAGLELSGTHLDLEAKDQLAMVKGALVSPDGRIDLDGKATLDANLGWPLDMRIKGDNFRALNLPEMQAYVSPDLKLAKTSEGMSLTGEVRVPKANILLRDLPQGAQDVSPDVVIVQQQKAEPEAKSAMEMDVRLALGKGVHFVGFGLNAFIDGQLGIKSEPGEVMTGSGEFRIEQGTYRAYGQDLVIEKGIILFPGGPITKPGINLSATRTIGEVVAGINAIGPAEKPRLKTFSQPPMAERDVISYILTGSPTSGAGKGAKLAVGRQINSDLSVEVGTDTKTGESEFKANYRINRAFSVQTTTGSASNAVDLYYILELGGKDAGKEETQ